MPFVIRTSHSRNALVELDGKFMIIARVVTDGTEKKLNIATFEAHQHESLEKFRRETDLSVP